MESNSHVVKKSLDSASLWKDKGPLLSTLVMELTERCNNDCIHCYINLPEDDRAAKQKELSTEAIKEILSEAASLGCMEIGFSGGEPLLREDFEALYLFARKLGLKVNLCTNATLITPQLANLLARIPPLRPVEITLYGMKRKSYEAVTRNPGSFEAAWRGIHLLLDKEVKVLMRSCLLPPNKDERKDFEAWASTVPGMHKPPSYNFFFDLRHRRDSQARNRLIRQLRLSPHEGQAVLTRQPQKYLSQMKRFCSKYMSPPGKQLFPCGAGVESGWVDAYGYFQPCVLLRHPDTVYDLKKGSLKQARMNFFPEIRKQKASNPDYLARCACCFLKSLCEQCPGRSWVEHGALDVPVEYFCEIAHTQARYLGLLKAGEAAWKVNNWQERIKNFSAAAETHKN